MNLISSLPNNITRAVSAHVTPIGKNPIFPQGDDNFMLYCLNQDLSYLRNKLKSFGEINVNSNDLKNALNELIYYCKQIEKPHKNILEKICLNKLIETFEIPDDLVSINLNITDDIDLSQDSILFDPIDGDIENTKNIQHINIVNEVHKRKFLNVLITGCALTFVRTIELYRQEIDDVDDRLCDLYDKILTINSYLLLTDSEPNINDKNPMQSGVVTVTLGNNNKQTLIDAQGEIFPILLFEAFKGFLELFISHGLPKNINDMLSVLKKSDFIKCDPWNMRLGPQTWHLFSKNLSELEMNELPYLFKRYSSLKMQAFIDISNEILRQTKTGKKYVFDLVKISQKDAEYDEFMDKMTQMNTNKGIITDDYIHQEQL